MNRRTVAAVVAVALAVGMVLGNQLFSPSNASAQALACQAIPKAYGRLVFLSGDLFFEADDGTIRGVSGYNCAVRTTITRY